MLDIQLDSMGRVTLTYESEVNATYVLLRGTTVEDIDTQIGSAPGNPGVGTFQDVSPPPGTAFYRIQRSAPAGPLDSDDDGLDDETEEQLGTDPSLPDSDGDGWTDGVEEADGTDPLDPASTPRMTFVGRPAAAVDFPAADALGSAGTPVTVGGPQVALVFPTGEESGVAGFDVTMGRPPVSLVFPSPEEVDATPGTFLGRPALAVVFPNSDDLGNLLNGATLGRPPVKVRYVTP